MATGKDATVRRYGGSWEKVSETWAGDAQHTGRSRTAAHCEVMNVAMLKEARREVVSLLTG